MTANFGIKFSKNAFPLFLSTSETQKRAKHIAGVLKLKIWCLGSLYLYKEKSCIDGQSILR